MNQKLMSLFSTASKTHTSWQRLLLACLLMAISTSTPQRAFAQCLNNNQFPAGAFSAPIAETGIYKISNFQYQEDYNQMTGALVGHTFRSTASLPGTYITVRVGARDGYAVAYGITPLNWTASSSGDYFIHYNTNFACGTATTIMTSYIENTTIGCKNIFKYPTAAFSAPAKGIGPFTISTEQLQTQFNEMTGAVAGSTFLSTASRGNTWITVRAGVYNGSVAAQGYTPLNWTASGGGSYFIHYNNDPVCGTAQTMMTSTVENTTPACNNSTQFPSTAFSAPVKGTGPFTISTGQVQSEFNEMTGAVAGHTFQSTASLPGTWITVRAGASAGTVVAQGTTPLIWTAAAGGSYFIHYNTNSICGKASAPMTTSIDNTTPACNNSTQFPTAGFSAPIPYAGTYTITANQDQQQYNQMTSANGGNTFQSWASLPGTWITVREGASAGTVVAQGTTPLIWKTPAGGSYFIHYNTNSLCGTASTNMTTYIINTIGLCSNNTQFPSAGFSAPTPGAGPYTITANQVQQQYNQMTSANAGNTFRSTASRPGTWISVRAGNADVVAAGTTPLDWTAAAGGSYYIEYNINSICGVGNTDMTTTIENTTPNCNNSTLYPNPFSAPTPGAGPGTITNTQYQQEYNQITSVNAGYTFRSTASLPGTWITVRAGASAGTIVAQGTTPLNWTAAAGGSYFIHYNTNSACGTASINMTTTIENTSPACVNSTLFPYAGFSAPTQGAGPYTITANQFQQEYNQMTSANAGNTFRSTASLPGTWITVRASSIAGTVVAVGTTPLNWTAAAGGNYFTHYNTNAACGIDNTGMTSTIENTSPPANDACAGATIVAALPYTSPVVFNTGATNDYTVSTCDGPYKNLWWKVTGICGTLTASTCGANFDTKLAVFTGSCGNFTQVACNNDNGPSCTSNAASVSWTTSAGTEYYISAGSSLINSPTGSMNLSVTAIPALAPVISGTLSFCSGSSTTLDAGAGYSSYLWSNGATTRTISVSTAGTFKVKVKNASNCSDSSASVTTSILALPATPVISGTLSFCAGSSTTLDAGAGYSSYLWSNGATTRTISVSTAGTFKVKVKNASNCSDSSASVTTSILALPATPVISGTLSFCAGSSTTLDAGAGYSSYLWSNGQTTRTISVNTDGTFYVTVKNASNCSDSSASVTTSILAAAPAIPGTISGTTAVCANSTEYTYTIAAVANATAYTWTAPANATLVSGQGTTLATFSFQSAYTTGSISVKSSNCFGTSAAKTLTVAKIATSATPGTISGAASVCSGSQQSYSIAAVANATAYTWTAPANASIVSGQGGLSVVVEYTSAFVSGSLSVVSSNCTGTSTARTLAVTKSAVPGTVGVISGITAGACSAEKRTYSIVAITNTTSYEWTAPANASIFSGQGSTSVVVQFAAGFTTGNLSVKGVNCSGTSVTARTLALSNVTAIPTVLTGPSTAVCAGSTQSYGVSPVSGANGYTWAVPTGAVINASTGTSIVVTFPSPFTSGAVTVKSGTACYTSAAKSLTVYSAPVTPASITGAAVGVCGGSTQTYTCPVSTTGATTYTWTVPTGAVINSGQGSTSISVTLPAGFATGNMSVASSNSCGTSTVRTLAIRSTTAQPGVITGTSSNLCAGGSFTYSIVAVTGATTYSWTAPAGCTITANTGTSITMTVPAGFVSGTLSVIAVNGCGNSVARTLAMSGIPAAPTSISGPAAVCPSAIGLLYSTPVVAGVSTYTWTVPTGVSITAGSGTSSITAKWGTVAGSVTVKAGNACGTNATAKALAVTLSVACREAVAEVAKTINLFPNPAVNLATLNFTSTKDCDYQIRVINALGQSVYSSEGKATEGANTLDLNLEKLSKGLYFVQLVQDGSKQQLSLVKK